MTRPVPPKAAIGAGEAITRPIFIVEIYSAYLFSLRFSSREQVVYLGNQFVPAGLKYDGASIAIYNDNGFLTSQFMSIGSTVLVNVFMSYGEPPFTDADWFEDFAGEIGTIEFTDWITFRLKEVSSRPLPQHVVNRPLCNHLPARGTKILTPTGLYVLDYS